MNQIRGSKILILAPAFFSLHNQIIDSLRKKGAIVDFIEDKPLKYNPYFNTSSLKFLKLQYYKILKPNRSRLLNELKCFNKRYDYFLCINGFSFDPVILEELKERNSKLVSILYVWDGFNFFDFSINVPFFDFSFSFDKRDSKLYNVEYLPLFWKRREETCRSSYLYDLFFVGTLHSDRYRVLKKILLSLDSYSLNYYLKLYSKNKFSKIDDLKYLYYKNINNPNAYGYVDEYLINKGIIKEDYIVFSSVSSDDFTNNMLLSKCVLDIELPYQTGITNRMITALSMNKKIITTNRSVIDTPFYNENMILVVDRENPEIPLDFFDINHSFLFDEVMSDFEIDNWIDKLFHLI